jgi:ATP:corrinoid adenosyltransferase
MIEILKSKSQATRFQILVEIATSGPVLHQRNIADLVTEMKQVKHPFEKGIEAQAGIEF